MDFIIFEFKQKNEFLLNNFGYHQKTLELTKFYLIYLCYSKKIGLDDLYLSLRKCIINTYQVQQVNQNYFNLSGKIIKKMYYFIDHFSFMALIFLFQNN